LWVLLLEKAFAKLWGAYGYLEGGHVILALQSFTGNHGVLMDVNKYVASTSADQFFDVIHGTLSHGFVMDVRPPNMLVGADSASVSERFRTSSRIDGVGATSHRDAVDVAARESTGLASEPRQCRDGIVPHRLLLRQGRAGVDHGTCL